MILSNSYKKTIKNDADLLSLGIILNPLTDIAIDPLELFDF